jgi:hypothetical protein
MYQFGSGEKVAIAPLKMSYADENVPAVFPIRYRPGGKVLTDTVTIYPIFYGTCRFLSF